MHTADLVDAYDAEMHFCDLPFLKFGRRRSFSGEIQTVECFEDNGLIRRELGKPGQGKVLVVDGARSTRFALIGDQIAELIATNGWNGIIIYGAIRDSAQINEMNVGVFCLSVTPKKPRNLGDGVVGAPVTFGGLTFKPGAFVYADSDGVLVSDTEKQIS